MIEDIDSKNAESLAIITMITDEIESIYKLKEENWHYELKRLKDTLLMSLYMVDERAREINKLTKLIMKSEFEKEK